MPSDIPRLPRATATACDRKSPEQVLSELASSVGPLRRVMAAIAARLVETRAHERLCFARLSDYAREQLGISARQLQELARVHRSLARLPGLEHALVSNALPWSKVRLVARVACEEDEGSWIDRAAAVSTRQLEREVREARAVRDPSGDAGDEGSDEAEPTRRVALQCSPALCAKWLAVHELAERVAGEKLSGGQALELVVAEAFSALDVGEGLAAAPIDPDSAERGSGRATNGDPAEAGPAPGPRVRRHDVPHAVLALASDLGEANAHSLDRRMHRAIRLEQTLDAAIAPLLRAVSCADYEWLTRYQTLAQFAREGLGMSARKARALLRLERAGDVCPELREAYRSGRLSWVKAQRLVPLLAIEMEGDWRQAWVDWAERVTVRRLTADVERALLLRAGTSFAWARCKYHPERVQEPISEEEKERERQVCAPPMDLEASERLTWRVPVDVALLFAAVAGAVRAQLAERSLDTSDASVFEALLDHAACVWTRRDPGARRPDPVIARDGYRCLVPGCTSRRSLHDHHVVFRSAGGSDAPENRATLCAFHHQRGVHEGRMQVRLRVSGRAPDDLEFLLPTGRWAAGDVRLPDEAPDLPATGRAA